MCICVYVCVLNWCSYRNAILINKDVDNHEIRDNSPFVEFLVPVQTCSIPLISATILKNKECCKDNNMNHQHRLATLITRLRDTWTVNSTCNRLDTRLEHRKGRLVIAYHPKGRPVLLDQWGLFEIYCYTFRLHRHSIAGSTYAILCVPETMQG